ncbi:MAG: hypothetical protein ABTQ73_12590 [Caldilineales bacterium]
MMESPNGTEELMDDVMDDLSDEMLHTELTDETYEELAVSEGAVVVGLAFWDSSLIDEVEEEPPASAERVSIDLDLYLDDNTLLELYGANLFPAEQQDPLAGLPALEAALVDLADSEAELSEVAQTEDNALALVFAVNGETRLIIAVAAWAVSEWEELPED